MKRENLETLTLTELCDLLVDNTLALLESIENKADGITILHQKQQVELLQEAIRSKRKADGLS